MMIHYRVIDTGMKVIKYKSQEISYQLSKIERSQKHECAMITSNFKRCTHTHTHTHTYTYTHTYTHAYTNMHTYTHMHT